MDLSLAAQIIAIVGGVVAIFAGLGAVFTYFRATRAKRAEWLASLYQRFYETDRHARIQRLLDYHLEPEYSELTSAVGAGRYHELADELYRYLNFFEFMGSLAELRQISRREIYALFEYDLQMLSRHQFILDVLAPQGFERLPRLLPRRRPLPAAS